jgi:hypothetical protein
MKKLMMVLLTIIALSSCSKNATKNCKCGIVTDDAIENGNDFTLTIKNDCSSNNKKFYVTLSTWMDYQVGANICMDEVW